MKILKITASGAALRIEESKFPGAMAHPDYIVPSLSYIIKWKSPYYSITLPYPLIVSVVTYSHAHLGLTDKDRTIKGLVVWMAFSRVIMLRWQYLV